MQQTIIDLSKPHQAAWDTAVALVEAGASASTEAALAAERARLLEQLRSWRSDGPKGQLGLRRAGAGTTITAGSGDKGSGSAAVPMAPGFPPPGQDWAPRLADGTVGRGVYLALQVEKLMAMQSSIWASPRGVTEATAEATLEYVKRFAEQDMRASLELPAGAEGVSMTRCKDMCHSCPAGSQERRCEHMCMTQHRMLSPRFPPIWQEERACCLVSFHAAPPTLGVGATHTPHLPW